MSSVQLSDRGKILLLVPIYLIIGAFLLEEPLMMFSSIGFLTLFIYSQVYLNGSLSGVEVKASLDSGSLYAGEPFTVKQTITTKYPLKMELRPDPDEDFDIIKNDTFRGMIEEKKDFHYKLSPTRRGYASIGKISGKVTDPMGLFETEFEQEGTIGSQIYASRDAIKRAHAYAKRVNIEEMIEDLQRFTTRSGELEEIREYQPGDRLRDIHWPSVSRFQRFKTKEYEKLAYLDCRILLDMSPSMRRGREKLEQVIFLTLEILKEFEISGYDIGISVFDHKKVLFHKRPEHRRGTYQNIYEEISKLPSPLRSKGYSKRRYKEDVTLFNLQEAEQKFVQKVSTFIPGSPSGGIGGLISAVREINRSGHKRSLVIIITDMETQPGVVIKSAEKLRSMGHVVWVIAPFSPLYEAEDVSPEILERAYSDHNTFESILRKLVRTGTSVYELYPKKEGLRILEEAR